MAANSTSGLSTREVVLTQRLAYKGLGKPGCGGIPSNNNSSMGRKRRHLATGAMLRVWLAVDRRDCLPNLKVIFPLKTGFSPTPAALVCFPTDLPLRTGVQNFATFSLHPRSPLWYLITTIKSSRLLLVDNLVKETAQRPSAICL
jgi:hypothetical protein